MPLASIREEEAKFKWCPFGRIVPGTLDANGRVGFVENVTAYNRIAIDSDRQVVSSMCIASQCMAWVEDDSKTKSGHCALMKQEKS